MKQREGGEELKDLVKSAVEQRRHLITYALARAMFDSLKEMSGGKDEWMAVESLSVLRKLIGGRFSLLREKWVAAGLPLREKKGDRSEAGNVSIEGWAIFSEWLLDRGYDSRLSEKGLFEIRPRTR